jgi:hypothetical protein
LANGHKILRLRASSSFSSLASAPPICGPLRRYCALQRSSLVLSQRVARRASTPWPPFATNSARYSTYRSRERRPGPKSRLEDRLQPVDSASHLRRLLGLGKTPVLRKGPSCAEIMSFRNVPEDRLPRQCIRQPTRSPLCPFSTRFGFDTLLRAMWSGINVGADSRWMWAVRIQTLGLAALAAAHLIGGIIRRNVIGPLFWASVTGVALSLL